MGTAAGGSEPPTAYSPNPGSVLTPPALDPPRSRSAAVEGAAVEQRQHRREALTRSRARGVGSRRAV